MSSPTLAQAQAVYLIVLAELDDAAYDEEMDSMVAPWDDYPTGLDD